MEDILASIRRIIADDEAGKPDVAPTPGSVTPLTPQSIPVSEQPAFGPASAGAEGAQPTREPAEFSRDDSFQQPSPIQPGKVAPTAQWPALPPRDAFSGNGVKAGESHGTRPAGGDSDNPRSVPRPQVDMNRPDAFAPEQQEPDVLELTQAMEMRRDAPSRAPFQTVSSNSDLMFAESDAGFAPEGRPGGNQQSGQHSPEQPREFSQDSMMRTLLSDNTSAAVTSAFGSLAHTVLAQNARTLDDLVGDLLRPMLKNWLDDNLPTIVERMVRAEIERVSRGRG